MSLTKDFKNGLFFSALGKYSNVVIQLIVNMILSRMLTPRDYGIVAVVNVFLVFFQMLADFGIGPAIIQNKQLVKSDIQSIFSFSIYGAVALGIGFMLLGYPISLFYGDTVYMPISVLLGFNLFFFTLMIVPQNLLLKEKKFKQVNTVLILSNLISGLVQIVLAFLGAKYYALIFGTLVKAFFMFVVFYSQVRIPLTLKLNMEPLKKIYVFSRNQLSFNFINYFSRNLDKILIGRFMGETSLGFYDKAYQLSLYPNQVLTNVITPVVQPILSDYETKLDVIKSVYFRITMVLASIGLPLSVFLFFTAEEVVLFLFGSQWVGSVLTFQILSLSIWEQMISSSTGAIYQSANRTDKLLQSGIISACTNVTAILIGVFLGSVEYVAVLILLSFTFNFFMNNYLLLYKVVDATFIEFFAVLKKPLFMGGLQLAAFLLLPELTYSTLTNLVLKSILFVLMFFLGLIFTGQIKLIRNFLMKE